MATVVPNRHTASDFVPLWPRLLDLLFDFWGNIAGTLLAVKEADCHLGREIKSEPKVRIISSSHLPAMRSACLRYRSHASRTVTTASRRFVGTWTPLGVVRGSPSGCGWFPEDREGSRQGTGRRKLGRERSAIRSCGSIGTPFSPQPARRVCWHRCCFPHGAKQVDRMPSYQALDCILWP